jgi:transcriptional regulator with XRE-family HTH domain
MPTAATAATAAIADASLGDLLRYWRRVRGFSQLDLAHEAGTTPRHLSFVETGRSRPSRDMVLRLAIALDVPLRDRNGILLAAGFAPMYGERTLDDPALERIDRAVERLLHAHDPLPSIAMNRQWDVVRTNAGADRLFGALLAGTTPTAPPNVLRLMLLPGPVRDAVANWTHVAPALLERARREAVGGVLDTVTAELLHEVRTGPDAAVFATALRAVGPLVPVVDVHFVVDGEVLRFYSVVSTIGTPIDVTAQELRVETFFSADDETDERWRALPSLPA